MYTNPKPHVLPADASTPLWTRATLWFAAVLVGGSLCGGLVGWFEMTSREAELAQNSMPPASAASGSRAREDTATGPAVLPRPAQF